MTRCFDGWWHDVIWETGTLSDRQLALEFFLFRFLLTLVKRNLDDRQFTSWIKEVNRLADSQSLFQYNHWKPYHYFHPNHQCGHKNLSITVIINHILCHVMNRWKSEYARRTQFEGKEPRGREMDTGGKSQHHCNIFIFIFKSIQIFKKKISSNPCALTYLRSKNLSVNYIYQSKYDPTIAY